MHRGNDSINSLLEPLISLLRSPPILADLDTCEIDALKTLPITEHNFSSDEIIIEQGARVSSLHLVRSGWGCVYRDLSSGQRQIIDFPMRSDFVGLRTAEGYSFNTVAAITPMKVFEIPLNSLQNAIMQAPKLSFMLIELLSRQRATLIEHLTNVGCRSALVRTAHLLLELSDRIRAYDQSDPDSYNCPLTQTQLADALGLTPIHLNRMLRELRENGLVSVKAGLVEILNRDRLVELAEYDGEFIRMAVFGKKK